MSNTFRRYAYFVRSEDLEQVRRQVKEKDGGITEVFDVPCRVLDPTNPVAVAAPHTWNQGFCQRRGSWYRQSPKKGQYLIGSSFPLTGFEEGTVITDSDFTPRRFPSRDEQREIIRSEIYQSGRPDEWEKVSNLEIIEIFKGYQVMGARETARLINKMKPLGLRGIARAAFFFREIFLTNCANHANFMDPKYFIEENGKVVPYSIKPDTMYICSSCAEMFDIVGSQHRVKMVVPCVGAALYGLMEVNRYYRVEKLGGEPWSWRQRNRRFVSVATKRRRFNSRKSKCADNVS